MELCLLPYVRATTPWRACFPPRLAHRGRVLKRNGSVRVDNEIYHNTGTNSLHQRHALHQGSCLEGKASTILMLKYSLTPTLDCAICTTYRCWYTWRRPNPWTTGYLPPSGCPCGYPDCISCATRLAPELRKILLLD